MAEALSFLLIGSEGCLAGRTVQASGPVAVLGRETDCQVRLEDIDASRHHARIAYADGQWTIEDLVSANGTFVNARRISGKSPLRASDVVRIGGTVFQFQPSPISSAPTRLMPAPAAAPAAPPASAAAAARPPAPAPAPSAAPRDAAPQPLVPSGAVPRTVAPTEYVPRVVPPAPAAAPAVVPRTVAPTEYVPQVVLPPPTPAPGYPPPAYAPAPYPPSPLAPPGPAYPRPAAPKRSGRWIVVLVVILVVLVLLGMTAGVLYSVGLIGKRRGGGGGTAMGITGRGSVTLSSGQSGYVVGLGGASITIPSGAVPAMTGGAAGRMTFSVAESIARAVALPAAFASHGAVYELGPEGFNFDTPVEVRLPIPAGVDPAGVLGLTWFDAAEDAWKIVSGSVDEAARTVAVATTHFSLWSICGPAAGSASSSEWLAGRGGWFLVRNGHAYNTGSFPGGRRLPTTVTYGICIESYVPEDPAAAAAMVAPESWTMTVSDYHPYAADTATSASAKWWLPAGSYQLTEVKVVSEVNVDPLYVPGSVASFRPIGEYRIEAGKVVSFADGTPESPAAWQEGRPRCFGRRDTSVGHGDVQVTLTWHKNVDLDLHVIDPNGVEVFYNNPTSPGGGSFDRDNECTRMVPGRPENIFWETAPRGTYQVKVGYYRNCTAEPLGPVSFIVRVLVQGVARSYTGTVDSDGIVDVAQFDFP